MNEQNEELMLGMKAQPVQYFFANWNYPDEEKKTFHEWIEKVVDHQVLDDSHNAGFTVENGSFFVSIDNGVLSLG